jgi:uncharacterized protein (DUF433 family)
LIDGVPVIAGTRIAPEFVWGFHAAGFTTAQIVEQYTHLHPEDVEAAIAYEANRRRRRVAKTRRKLVSLLPIRDVS